MIVFKIRKWIFVIGLAILATLVIFFFPTDTHAASNAAPPVNPGTFMVRVRDVEVGGRGLHFNINVFRSKGRGRWREIRNWHVYVKSAETGRICVHVYETHTRRGYNTCARTTSQLAWKIKSSVQRDLQYYIKHNYNVTTRTARNVAVIATYSLAIILVTTLALAL